MPLFSRRRRQEDVLESVSIDDAGHAHSHSPFHYAYVAFCYVFSHLFGIMFLSMLMCLSLINAVLERSPLPTAKDTTGNTFTEDVSQKLPKKQRILTRKLEYYVELEGFALETHKVTTTDGFNLVLHHITVPGESSESKTQRYPVLLMHGLLQSSAAYCTSGPQSLAYTLVKSGYDVWLGNNRCGFVADHLNLKYRNLAMWEWSIQEMGTLDLQAHLNYVKGQRNVEKIALVSHSQGTTQTFLALSKDSIPELGQSISCFVALSPAVYSGELLRRWFLRWILHLPLGAYRLLFGYHSFLPIMLSMPQFMSNSVYATMGYLMFHFMFGWDDELWDLRYRARELLFSPVYVSAELMYWWLGPGGFSARGCIFRHEHTDLTWFDDNFPPLLVVVPEKDNIVNPYKFVERLEMVEKKVMKRVEICELKGFSHLDVLWARSVTQKVAQPMMDFIKDTRPAGDWLDLE